MTMRDLEKLVFEVTGRSEQWRVLVPKDGGLCTVVGRSVILKSKWRRLEDWFSPEKPWPPTGVRHTD
jgi:hypothetical protein